MTNFIPIFPLEIVVYPEEQLNLHIFEPKYIQLINECIEENKPFGIPVVLDKKIQQYGVLIEIEELVERKDSGEMNIRTRCKQIFNILEVVKEIPDKLYSGAIVSYPENNTQKGDSKIAQLIIEEVHKLYKLLNVEDKFPVKGEEDILSYTIAHYIGLSKEQEYELLTLFAEMQRLEYIRRHLKEIAPMLQELESMKARIKLNGHFRNLSLDDLDI
ncbi:MAG: LON peptidase substrate-binding domain-containing protein [Flavipsychrobacter sp.]